MSALIAVCGLTGVGKTTSIEYLKSLCDGEHVYLGSVVLEEVRRREMPLTRESERLVRIELREKDRAAMAKLRSEQFLHAINSGRPILVDAIMVVEEFDFIKSMISEIPAYLLVIESSMKHRCERLSNRANRPFTLEEIKARDKTEIEHLGSGDVFAIGTHHVQNDGSIAELQSQLESILAAICR